MNRSQRQLIMLVVLLGVLVAVYARAFKNPAGSPSASTQMTSSPTTDGPATSSTTIEPLITAPSAQRDAQRERARALTWSRDPFTQGASAGEGSGLTLSGILWDPGHPMAIINGATVHVGDEFEGYRILDIAPDHVSVSDGTDTFQLLIVP